MQCNAIQWIGLVWFGLQWTITMRTRIKRIKRVKRIRRSKTITLVDNKFVTQTDSMGMAQALSLSFMSLDHT